LNHQRKILLEQVIADSHSTPEERTAAQQEITSDEHVPQEYQDRELEKYLTQTSPRSERLPKSSFSPSTQVILNDLGFHRLGVVPPEGAVDRLTALLARTHSAIVRDKVTSALEAIKYLIESRTP
jgi:hypothetical protein